MKNYKILIITLVVMPLFADLSIEQMETMVNKIKAKRTGKARDKNSTLMSPFVLIQQDGNASAVTFKKAESKAVVFQLGGIMNNKAFINKQWLGVGEIIEGYKLKEIKSDSVTLVRGQRTVKVFLKKSKQILQLSKG